MTEQLVKSKVLVAIIDQKPLRREGLKKAFVAANADVVCYFPGGNDVASVPGSSRTKDYLVRLWHATDFGLQPNLPPVEAFRTIFFSGNGGSDPKIPDDAEERIYRPVGDLIGILTVVEVREIVDYVSALERGESASKPAVLRPPIEKSVVQSLAILAQGYLVVYSEYLRGRNMVVPSDIVGLLVDYGWAVSEDGVLSRLARVDGAKYFEDTEMGVQTAQWWDVFGFSSLAPNAAEAAWNALEGDLRGELQLGADAPLPDALSQFVSLLRGGRVSSPDAVVELLRFLHPYVGD